MNIHEYQGHQLFKEYNIESPAGRVASTPDEVETIAKELGKAVVVKAQVLVGGRGKAGGVKLAKNHQEARQHAESIIGMDIKGFRVNKVFVCEATDIKEEKYLAFLNDRDNSKIVMMASAEGGVEIETVAEKTPEKIYKVCIDPLMGIRKFHPQYAFENMFSTKDQVKQATDIAEKMYRLFIEKDCTLVEINPLVVDGSGKVIAVDAKLNFDDSAMFRQKGILELKDIEAIDKDEDEAASAGLSYVGLDGAVGCMVNGAGLAMATMDAVKFFGGSPANFLDVGGSSNPDKVVKAFEIILRHSNVKSILINIFGGITRCDDIATGIINALNKIKVNVPIVVRLTGTNEAEAHEILKSNDKLLSSHDMNTAVKMAVEQANS